MGSLKTVGLIEVALLCIHQSGLLSQLCTSSFGYIFLLLTVSVCQCNLDLQIILSNFLLKAWGKLQFLEFDSNCSMEFFGKMELL